MIAAIVILQVLDILTTYYLVEKRGMREGNPIMNWAMQRLGFWPALLGIKGIFVAGVLTVAVPYYVEVGIMALYVAVVANNLRLVKGLG